MRVAESSPKSMWLKALAPLRTARYTTARTTTTISKAGHSRAHRNTSMPSFLKGAKGLKKLSRVCPRLALGLTRVPKATSMNESSQQKSKSPSGKGGSKHKKDVGDPTDEKARSCRRRAESFQKLSAEGKQGIAGHAYDQGSHAYDPSQ